ncbi:type III secretion system export apparatus subunit SctT [Salinicola rhizosphaerae]|uniref:EscT/YscT/HrcT family type III secretion system export apparatus protein n=1 Tax=Salinicola rhizosphaerae TaxID=1443141 RepID=A0ABQ3DRI6_9GAMM|nr:type III secretion system export apparatus subunit SctT [Salinicola rhizosphaerae]GHB11880.1 EscT/YscT/HrcT family type III secretion system export apparatus protein [Salinicola rhizosphaerae]
MNYDVFAHFLNDFAYPLIAAVAIGVARALGMVIMTPAFNRLGLTGMIRSAVAVTISIPLTVSLFNDFTALREISSFALMGIVIKELLIGVAIGLVFGVPFWAAEVAGELIDLQRGSTMSQILDPMGATETGVTSTLLSITLLALFFITGGFMLLLDGFYRSYALWPAIDFTPLMTQASALAVLGLLDQVMKIGVLMIAPLVIALLVADLMLAYVARMAPNLHAFDLSLPIKNLLFAFLILIYVVFLIPLMVDQLDVLKLNMERLSAILGAMG